MRFDLTINEFVENLYNKSSLDVYDFNTFRPYCHTKDFSRAIIKVLNSQKKIINNQVFNIGNSKQNYSKKYIAQKIKKFLNKKVKIKFTKKSNDKRNYKVDFTKIKKSLKFETKYNVDYRQKQQQRGNYKIT